MGYISDKQLQADYLEIVRKEKQRDIQSHQRAQKKRRLTGAFVVTLIIVFICYLAAFRH